MTDAGPTTITPERDAANNGASTSNLALFLKQTFDEADRSDEQGGAALSDLPETLPTAVPIRIHQLACEFAAKVEDKNLAIMMQDERFVRRIAIATAAFIQMLCNMGKADLFK